MPLVQGEGRATRQYVTSIFQDYVWTRDAEHSLIARRPKPGAWYQV
ncbi:MAG: hypothetical protein ACRELA_12435 [Candidatus Rokuibacteriota bacterium]